MIISNVTFHQPNTALPSVITTVCTWEIPEEAPTDEIPIEAPAKSWFLKPIMIIGIPIGGFIVFVVIAIALLAILSRTFKRRFRADRE